MKTFLQLLSDRYAATKSLLCVGLDPDLSLLPEVVIATANPQLTFNKAIIDATHDLVCAYKPQSAFYEEAGEAGHEALVQTVKYIHEKYPGIPVILDAKRADIGSTSESYATAAFDKIGADAITLNPYLGQDALEPFLRREEKGCIVLVHTSNPGADEFQNVSVDGRPMWQFVLETVATKWNTKGNCLAVMGATYPEQLAQARTIAPEMVFLVPGIGAQGGDAQATVTVGRSADGFGLIVNSSRGIIFADSSKDFALGARAAAQETLKSLA
jgi:orotidine-5'-phosphate decarboxylase